MVERDSKILEFFKGVQEGINIGFMELKMEMQDTRKELAPIEPDVLERVIDDAITTEDEIYEKPGIDKWQVEEYRHGFRKGLEDFLLQNNDAFFEPVTGGKSISDLYELLESGTMGTGGGGSGFDDYEESSKKSRGGFLKTFIGGASLAAMAAKAAVAGATGWVGNNLIDTVKNFREGNDASNDISDFSDDVITILSGGRLQDGADVIEAVVTQFENLKDVLGDVSEKVKDTLLGTASAVQDWFADVEFGVHSSVNDAIDRHGQAMIKFLDTGSNKFTGWLSEITGVQNRIDRRREANRAARDAIDEEAAAAGEARREEAERRHVYAARELEQWGDVVSPERRAELEERANETEMDFLRESDPAEYYRRKKEQETPEEKYEQAVRTLEANQRIASDMVTRIEELESKEELTGIERRGLDAMRQQLKPFVEHVIPNLEKRVEEAALEANVEEPLEAKVEEAIEEEPLRELEIRPSTQKLWDAALAQHLENQQKQEEQITFDDEYPPLEVTVTRGWNEVEADVERAALNDIVPLQMENRDAIVDSIEGRAATSGQHGGGGGGAAIVNAPTVTNVTNNNNSSIITPRPPVDNGSPTLRMYNAQQHPDW